MNGNELVVLLMATAMLAALAYRITGSIGRTLVSTLVLVPMLFLALEGATQFLTCDETYMVLELEDVRSSNFRQWNMGGYRTSILLTGTIFSALKGTLLSDAPTAAELHGLTKSIHWLVGFVVLVMIHEALRRYFVPKDRQPLFFVLFFGVALMLPTNILAFKVANYDLLSMMLGMLCFTLTLGAVTTGSLPAALGAVVAGSLASQEKIIASPFLALATSAAVFIAATWPTRLLPRRGAQPPAAEPLAGVPWGSVAGAALAVILASALPVMLTWSIVNGIHGGLKFSFVRALTPLTGYISVTADAASASSTMFLLATAGLIGVGIVASYVYRVLRTRLASNGNGTRLTTSTSIIVLLFVAIGIYGTYAYNVYVHPYYPTPSGIYLPTKSFNDATAHYMQPTFASHLTAGVTMSYSVIANGLPSAFWLLLLVAAVVGLAMRRPLHVPAAWSAAALFVLLFPLAYAVTQTPFGSRYLNLFLFVIAVFVVFAATGLASLLRSQLSYAAAAAFLLLVAGELSLFRPVVGSFTPVWNTPEAEFAAKPLYGKLQTGFWAGWGEENYLAGKIIAEKHRQPGQNIRILCSYPGDWLSTDPTISFVPYNQLVRATSSTDFYVLSRQAIYQLRYPFPHGQKPLFTIDYGGATMAWVFRGDQLSNTIMFVSPERDGGYLTEVPERRASANDLANPQRSTLTVYENGKPLGPPHAPFDDIRKLGRGRFNHWENLVFFTTSDNSDPRTNGRTYEVR
ncbi:MAG TPA: hypothetical protein DCZ59_06040 [Bacteroidetes bacterium]|nr:hypothetical protein [Bacteroidota bacterium]